jgi:3-oxoacyl-[acyl-carrier-protein] synthase-3
MFINIANLLTTQKCSVIGYGHTELQDDPERLREVTQAQFIDMLSFETRCQLLGTSKPWLEADKVAVADGWISMTGIHRRVFFNGPIADLALIAARKCLAQAGVSAMDLDAIVAGSNTGPGYPSLADRIKHGLGQHSQAMAYDLQEACPVGCVAVFNGWNLVRSGVAKKVLVVCAEKATTLAKLDDWKGSNLFGDAAFAFLLSASEQEAFKFFDIRSEPFDGQLHLITKTEDGFAQKGLGVHKFVGREVVRILVEGVNRAGILPADIRHLVPHQPSSKTLNLLEEKLRENWPTFGGQVHRNVEYTGNTSGASTGSLISRGVASGDIKPGELVLVSTFGAGLSVGNYAFVI